MKQPIIIIVVALLLLCGKKSYAQFSLSGEFRPRTELSHGAKSLASDNQDASLFTSQRTRLNAIYKSEKVLTMLVLQDVRTWGSQAQLVGNEDFATSVHQAWAEVFLAPEFSLKAGRQELVYDDQRILGNVGWAQQARSHDVAVFKYQKDISLHVGIAHHENSTITNNIFDGNDAYKDIQFAWFNKKWDDAGLSLLFLNNGVPVNEVDGQKVNYSQTFGGHGKFTIGEFKFSVNAYLQTGEDVAGNDISAHNLLLEAICKHGVTWGYERLSGTGYDDSKNKSFNPLYGTNHKFNGFMDYFFVGNHLNNVGLNNIYAKYNYSKDELSLYAHVHYFSSAAKITSGADRYLGTEVDLGAGWKISPEANFSGGFSFMIADDSMELLKGGDKSAGNYWAYLMLTVTPTFIK
ncbi:hypothetical protein [Gaoshiqia sediminis]|uniref:Alginate export domain-containing protein n=1 Tax=Gaoshiqia sediminis TaxID=2986998 RepID=A0AA41Y7F7_9BACT|nr:hypothetical protein [Gaoshiqia sediminis]MCW0482876.1 hypothetical protein [Gaoshiqia sediminis]